MLGAAARSRPTMSVHTRPRPPCSWEPSLVAPCLACPRRAPTLNISVSLLMRFLMTCLCPRGGRWPRPPLARDTSSSEYAGSKCRHSFLYYTVLGTLESLCQFQKMRIVLKLIDKLLARQYQEQEITYLLVKKKKNTYVKHFNSKSVSFHFTK